MESKLLRSSGLAARAKEICANPQNAAVLDCLVLLHREQLENLESASLEELRRAQGISRGVREVLRVLGVNDPSGHLVRSQG